MFIKNGRTWIVTFCSLMISVGGFASQGATTLASFEEMQAQQGNLFTKEALKSSNYQYGDDTPYLYRIHPSAYYYPVAVTGSGYKIQLHDGSLWHVYPYHAATVKTWVSSDPLFIKPKSSCCSSYRYVLHNRATQGVVEVNLSEPPIATGEYTRWVIGFSGDDYNRIVHLNDNTAWRVSSNAYSYNSWQVGHRIVIGVNNDWRVADYPHVLINTSLYNTPYCEADVAY